MVTVFKRCIYWTVTKNNNLPSEKLRDAEIEIKGTQTIVLDGVGHRELIDLCNSAFRPCIQVCCTDYVEIGQLIITRATVDALVDSYKVKMLPHY